MQRVEEESVEYKVCTKCKEQKGRSLFYRKKTSSDGLHSHCKTCRNIYRMSRPRSVNYRKTNLDYYYRNKDKWKTIKANRRAAQLNANVKWANKVHVDFIYFCSSVLNKQCKVPWEVDHIYPLQGEGVCGLHVENNLQLLPRSVNRAKGNRVQFVNCR